MVLLLRIGRRKAHIPTLEEFLQVEFSSRSGGLDLRPSVYEVGPNEVIQAYAEHVASCLLYPPRGSRNWDVGDAGGAIVTTCGDTRFTFTRAAHRELTFTDAADLMRFVERIYGESQDRRCLEVSRAELQGYVRTCCECDDHEWLAFLGSQECSEAWRTFAGDSRSR